MTNIWRFLKRGGSWLREHWYVPLFVVGVVLGAILSGKLRRRGPPVEQVKAELEAINAGARAKALEAELGAARAAAQVEAEYHAEVAKLDEKEKAEAARLREDPRALARFLVRSGSRGRTHPNFLLRSNSNKKT